MAAGSEKSGKTGILGYEPADPGILGLVPADPTGYWGTSQLIRDTGARAS